MYDRQELNDILRFLQQEGVLKRRWNPEFYLAGREEIGLEEKETFWFVGDYKHWYQV